MGFKLVPLAILAFTLTTDLISSAPVPKKEEPIVFDPENGFVVVTPPAPHYNHDPLYGVDVMAAQNQVAAEQAKDVPPPLLPPMVDMSLAGMGAMDPMGAAPAMPPMGGVADPQVPEDAVSRQIFGGENGQERSVSNPKCQTICDFEKTVIKPEPMTVEIPQPPRYEQYVIPPPPGSNCAPTYGVRPVHQAPLYHTCVQYKKETLPMRAQFASEPVDPNFLNSLDPGQAEAVVDDSQHQHAAAVGWPAQLQQTGHCHPVKTSALD